MSKVIKGKSRSSKKTSVKPEFNDQHRRELDGLQENCYQNLHKPMVVKVGEFKQQIWYVCQECLDVYMKGHPELKPLVIAFKR